MISKVNVFAQVLYPSECVIHQNHDQTNYNLFIDIEELYQYIKTSAPNTEEIDLSELNTYCNNELGINICCVSSSFSFFNAIISDGSEELLNSYTKFLFRMSLIFPRGNPIKRIVLPEGLFAINENTFSVPILFNAGFKNLEEVVLPSTLFTIGPHAFENCFNLKKVNFQDAGKTISSYLSETFIQKRKAITNNEFFPFLIMNSAFAGCCGLTELIAPESLYFLEFDSRIYDAFNYETIFELFQMSSYLAFAECYSKDDQKIVGLKTVDLSKTKMTNIPTGVFKNCSLLSDFKFPPNLKTLNTPYEARVIVAGYNHFDANSVGTFEGCWNLPIESIPKNIEYIGNYCFRNMNKEVIDLSGFNNITELGDGVFRNNILLKKVVLPPNIKKLSDELFISCESLEQVVFTPSNITYLGEQAFENCKSLSGFEISDFTSISEFNRYVFYNCEKLLLNKTIKIPENIKTIGAWSLYLSGKNINPPWMNPEYEVIPNTTKIIVPSSVSTIGLEAFGYFDVYFASGMQPLPDLNGELFNSFDAKPYGNTIYINEVFSSPEQLDALVGNAINWKDITPTQKNTSKINGDRLYMKNENGEWIRPGDLSKAPDPPPDDLFKPVQPPQPAEQGPILSYTGNTIINIGISKDEEAPSKLSITVPTNLAILIHAPSSAESLRNPVDVFIGGGNKGSGKASGNLKFVNYSVSKKGTPITAKIHTVNISSLGEIWHLVESVSKPYDINMKLEEKALNNGPNQFGIILNKPIVTPGEISPTTTSVPVSVAIGGTCADYQSTIAKNSEVDSPAFNINWRISKTSE